MKQIIIIFIFAGIFFSCDNKTTLPKNHQAHKNHDGHNHDDHGGHDDATCNDDHDEHGGHDDHGSHKDVTCDDDHGATEESQEISEQALKNMKVTIEEIDSSTYTIFSPIPAFVSDHPLNTRPIYAPLAGRIKSFTLEPGQVIESNSVLLEIIRDPIKRPQLNLVQDILRPASEEYHTSIAALRSSVRNLKVLNSELNRLKDFKTESEGLSIVPQKDLIELRYEISKSTQELENNRAKLKLHGLSASEIQKIEQGKELVQSPRLWLNALKQNNIWTKSSENIFSLMTKEQQKNRWVIASIGELSAEEIVDKNLVDFFTKNTSALKSFLEIASLLQQGHSLTDVENLYALGALESIIKIKAPINKNSWDLKEINIKAGQVVARGDVLFTLLDPSKMLLTAEPTGSEYGLINNAIQKQFLIDATPLIKNSSIELKDLKISKITGQEQGRTLVLLPSENSILSEHSVNGTKYRNWNLRKGLKYTLKVPVKKLEDVIVLPSKAIIDHSSDKVVFVRENEKFIRRKVIVVYQNNDVAVIGEGSELLPEEAMVTNGAFALQLALIAGTPQAVDPHAGHNH
ncbi:HlyD family efflux transporter periplasmic adaptor subunit [Lentisphaera marina]|uniref:HlyD family efflux transporter periplasmic adaptor subunit n=1 Tax=Lentisphaera marina TaxID=1111041 RepID=UPI002366B2A4|nr:HlyD family efflux transporter periplasmic adaptor subunit [Lentisphaera marina]MDD7985784.1 HlyD family efflux transporter periplasmic adaptor subunit [Lentisphaera marina]